jgi:hypothetical protein
LLLWVEDATSAYEENYEMARSFMEPTVEKMSTVKCVLEFIRTENGAHICRNVKTTMEFSCQGIKNGNQITIQITGLKYIDHMVGM